MVLSHQHQQMQDKTRRLASEARKGFKINNDKTKVMRANTQNEDPIQLGYEGIEDIDRITYLSCVVDQQGGSDALLKGNGGFIRLGNV